MLDADLGQYDMEVELTLFTLEEGGRKEGLPIETDLDGPRIYIDGYELRARFTLQDREILNPGEMARVFVTFFFYPQVVLGKLHPDRAFALHEGYHPIGKGRILSILNLEKHIEEAKRREEEERTLPESLRSRFSTHRDKHKKKSKKNKSQ